MPKVALIKVYPSGYCEDYSEVIQSITEWVDISEEDLKLLKQFISSNGGYTVLEYVDNQKEKIDFCVNAQIKAAKEWEDAQKREKEERARKALERKLKREKKDVENKRKLLEQLKQELGE